MNKTSDKYKEFDNLIKLFLKFFTRYSLIFSSFRVLILYKWAIVIDSSSLSNLSLWLNDHD
jgi:hypothetical protein